MTEHRKKYSEKRTNKRSYRETSISITSFLWLLERQTAFPADFLKLLILPVRNPIGRVSVFQALYRHDNSDNDYDEYRCHGQQDRINRQEIRYFPYI